MSEETTQEELSQDDLDEINSCDCCEFPCPVGGLEKYSSDTKELCQLCANTLVGAWYEYPEQYCSDTIQTMKQVNYVGNQLRRDITNLEKKA